jgi:hypothetical protein
MKDIQEADWKYMSRLKPVLLERLCNRILDKVQKECHPEKRSAGSHEQYLRVFKLVANQDKILADCFDDWSRSRLFEKIALLSRHKIITQDELLGLSEETRNTLRLLAGM